VKNEEDLRHIGGIYDLLYSKAHPPKAGAIPHAEIKRYASPVRRPSKMTGPIS
jgi:hypothetical protein